MPQHLVSFLVCSKSSEVISSTLPMVNQGYVIQEKSYYIKKHICFYSYKDGQIAFQKVSTGLHFYHYKYEGEKNILLWSRALPNFSVLGQTVNILGFCGPYDFCHNYSTLLFKHESSYRQFVNKWAGLFAIKLSSQKLRWAGFGLQDSPCQLDTDGFYPGDILISLLSK